MEREIRFINLTPHPVVIVSEGKSLTIPVSGQEARVKINQTRKVSVNSIPVVETTFGEVENLPNPEEGTVYIVSSLVANVIVGRKDVFAPDTSPEGVIRNEQGRIVGVKRLQYFV